MPENNKLAFIGREYNPVWDSDKREVKEFNLNTKQPPLFLDFNKKKHTAIFSKSGGGKSYLLRVLAEEAQRTIGNYAQTQAIEAQHQRAPPDVDRGLARMAAGQVRAIRSSRAPRCLNLR